MNLDNKLMSKHGYERNFKDKDKSKYYYRVEIIYELKRETTFRNNEK